MFTAPAQAIGFLPFYKPNFAASSVVFPAATASKSIVP